MHASVTPPSTDGARIRVAGKFFFCGEEKFYVCGVTYGPFASEGGFEYHGPECVGRDFAAMAASGINSVRLYTTPPRWLLDCAQQHGLKVMIGIAWEQHIAFLDDPKRVRSIIARVRAGVRSCTGHPAVLAYAIGNEIPAGIIRWHGRAAAESFLKKLYFAAKHEDPGALVTYVNYPSTEYLRLNFVDFVCFNLFLEKEEIFDSYVARLQNIAHDRPLVLTEIGLDSRRHGQETQAAAVDWQLRTAFASGCAGAFVFSWTDEWHRGGHAIEDWDFGLTDRQRAPKPAFAAARKCFREIPFTAGRRWPRVSVIVCSYNGARTLEECLSHLERLDYPDYEIIVVNDGSTDATAAIAGRHRVRLMAMPNAGLSAARNVGLAAATGELVSYIDDDAFPDRHWLTYLAAAFEGNDFAGLGGPNLLPPNSKRVATCVAHSPGGPTHVLLSDRIAEHIPGCNMAFRRERLVAIGGFDAQFRVAGDDVDVCWRLQQRGWQLGFAPAAVVWHHRRNSIAAYWKQQRHYGIAESMLARKWPEKYNMAGQLTWMGRLYGPGVGALMGFRQRVYHGIWGDAPFQSAHDLPPAHWLFLPLTPDYYLLLTGLAGFSLLALVWSPLLPVVLLFCGAAGLTFLAATRHGFDAPLPMNHGLASRLLISLLHVLQPLARLCGRLGSGLHPWRHHRGCHFVFPRPLEFTLWSEQWRATHDRLGMLEAALRTNITTVFRGSEYDRWDLEVRGGLFGGARLWTVAEDHGEGRQLVRVRIHPNYKPAGLLLLLCLALTIGLAGLHEAWLPASAFAAAAFLLGMETFREAGAAVAALVAAVRIQHVPSPPASSKSQELDQTLAGHTSV